jgi:peptide-methionine (S)-S-oxide reductase
MRKFRKANLMRLAAVLSVSTLQVASCAGPLSATGSATAAVNLPRPAVDEPAAAPDVHETALLAGGCFWGVQGVFEHVRGVDQAVSGYAGGGASAAHYDLVSTGSTGHAEAVQITYDPSQISYGELLRVYFSVVHDPTQLNMQGPDIGTQYRSAIFPRNDTQTKIATSYIAQLDDAKAFASPIATRIENGAEFFPAEAHHQDFLNSNPTNPYIAVNDMPKLDDLKREFPEIYRDQAVLAHAGGN